MQMTLDALRAVPLFGSLDDAAASELRGLLSWRNAAAGESLFRKGDQGDAMFLIGSGRVRISLMDGDGHDVTLAELGHGEFFGEMALIDGRQRSADATVLVEANLAVLPREAFVSFLLSRPEVALKMLAALTERLRKTDEMLRRRVSRNANEEDRARATVGDQAADLIATFGGSWTFILISVVVIVIWIWLNSGYLPETFDPAPYELLGLVLSVVAAIQAPIIMMSQNRQGDKDRLRADLDYQVNLKNELALAEVLRRLEVLENERLPGLVAELAANRSVQ